MSKFSNTVILTVVASMFLSACKPANEPQGQMPTPEVVVANPLVKSVVEWDEYTGRFEATERVEIRARVPGYLSEIRFRDGENVKKGATLFVIDQRPYQIALERAEAQYELAVKELHRIEGLRQSRAVSKENFDIAKQDVAVAKSFLDEAKLNLEFTEVKSPIDGSVSRSLLDVGNLIDSAMSVPLTTVVATTPIHFYFEASEQQLLKYIRLDRAGKRPGSRNNSNPLYVKLLDEKSFNRKGIIDFVGVEVDQGTGTIQGRAIFDNSDNVIYPGLFGRARIAGSGVYEAMLVPDEIIGTDQSRKFVMIVDDQGIAQMQFVKLGPLRDSGLRIVRSGLNADTNVIINGLQRARPGTPVTTRKEVIEEAQNNVMPDDLTEPVMQPQVGE